MSARFVVLLARRSPEVSAQFVVLLARRSSCLMCCIVHAVNSQLGPSPSSSSDSPPPPGMFVPSAPCCILQ